MSGKHRSVLLALGLAISLFFIAGEASAVLHRVGPINPAPSVGNFPAWYQDNTGLTLEFCDPQNQAEVDGGWCLLLPADVTIPEVFPTNFFDEHFWFAADADANDTAQNPAIKKAILVLAVEAAFAADVEPGGQVAFARIRIRLEDVPATGTYRFIHPYGEEVVEAVQGDRIFVTDDVGINCAPGDFTCALQSRLGPFLLPSNTPGGPELAAVAGPVAGKLHIASPDRSGPVTGSTLPNFIDSTGASRNHNIFRIEGPPGSNLDGAGNDFLETTNFTLMGRLFSGVIAGEVTVNRASYTRNSLEQKVDVFATGFETTQGRLPTEAPPEAVLPQLSFFDAPCALDEETGDPIRPFAAPVGANEIPMVNDGNDFWGQVPVAAIPAGVCVKDNVTLAYIPKEVGDRITISEAFFSPNAQSLSVKAFSSDETVPPTLTLGGFADLADQEIVVSPLAAPPASVRVLSSAGGVNEYQVTTSPPQPGPPVTGVSVVASPDTPQSTGTTMTFVAAASGGSGAYNFQFWLFDGAAWTIQQPYSADASWTWDTSGLGPGPYVAAVWAKSADSTVGDFEAVAYHPFTLSGTPAPVGVSLFASPSSPQTAGTPVTYVAAGGGGSGKYEYQFWLFNGATWSVRQPYSGTATWEWDTTGAAPGAYTAAVWIRNAGSPAEFEAVGYATFEVTAGP